MDIGNQKVETGWISLVAPFLFKTDGRVEVLMPTLLKILIQGTGVHLSSWKPWAPCVALGATGNPELEESSFFSLYV